MNDLGRIDFVKIFDQAGGQRNVAPIGERGEHETDLIDGHPYDAQCFQAAGLGGVVTPHQCIFECVSQLVE